MDWVRGGRVIDGDLIGFMLRPLSDEELWARRERYGLSLPREESEVYYRCVYWDEETRLCGAYANRPDMCRDYPYPLTRGDAGCEHGCDCKGAPLVTLGEN